MSKGKFVLGAVIGAVAGVAAGILTAPKSGKETRADIKAKAGELKDGAEKKFDEVKGAGEKVVKDGKKTIDDYADRAKRAGAAAKKEFDK